MIEIIYKDKFYRRDDKGTWFYENGNKIGLKPFKASLEKFYNDTQQGEMDLTEATGKGLKKGLGDTIKTITNALGFTTCDACEERRKKLNKLFPYLRDIKEPMNDKDIRFINFIRDKNTITFDDVRYLTAMFNRLYHTNLQPCLSCSSMAIDLRAKLINTYDAYYNENEK